MGTVRISFKIEKGFEFFTKEIERINFAQKAELRRLGDATAARMRQSIRESKVRPQAGEPSTLEDNIKVNHLETPDQISWGVGEITILDEKAPYWRAVNFGSAHIIGLVLPKGGFSPGDPQPSKEENRKGRWKTGAGTFHAIIKNPIPPMNYIEKTINFVKGQIIVLARIFKG